MSTTSSYTPHRASTIEQIQIRNDVSYRLRRWPAQDRTGMRAPPLLLAHGWMDVSASFQRFVDTLSTAREVVAIDWRGFGGSMAPRPSDSYWFYDYYADLDAVIDHISPDAPIDLLGHSMGGNIAMIYAGTCPGRIQRLINVEGFGLARTSPSDAPGRLARWLSELKTPVSIRTFASVQEVAVHLMKRSPHMEEGFALWLAGEWAESKADGRWHVMADAVHKRVNPILYRCDEVLAAWENIQASVLWVEGDKPEQTPLSSERYSREEFEVRLDRIKTLKRLRINECGHMVHLEQPGKLARAVESFLGD
ncbi:alpha/beta hydrolase [Pusillimonas sp.]|uniref:alpha/beta fold hydrolase n=1 Tax=Pusillimonas sp. TaxID=3040095 RepID=UPI0029A3C5BF|nr:alpha/beta hydrolase [Pusillimonas sp.]MDX3894600.1 alpha/beta hydrolase [Pusillimonas sp.]